MDWRCPVRKNDAQQGTLIVAFIAPFFEHYFLTHFLVITDANECLTSKDS